VGSQPADLMMLLLIMIGMLAALIAMWLFGQL
jgi:hypothetical protein